MKIVLGNGLRLLGITALEEM
ncbi:hypothetical protein HYS50_00135 [Candidatus Woesearchaeota archaeon]|nr:hypothetical protein [Candidatus Woesearchaeota archaeon]